MSFLPMRSAPQLVQIGPSIRNGSCASSPLVFTHIGNALSNSVQEYSHADFYGVMTRDVYSSKNAEDLTQFTVPFI